MYALHIILYAYTHLYLIFSAYTSLGISRDVTNEYVYIKLLSGYQYTEKPLCHPPLSTLPESHISPIHDWW